MVTVLYEVEREKVANTPHTPTLAHLIYYLTGLRYSLNTRINAVTGGASMLV